MLERADDSSRAVNPSRSRLCALVLCDIVDSTALVERLGDSSAVELIRLHDEMARAVIQQHRGLEIDKTDGFLVIFEKPIQAVGFALMYQRGLRRLAHQVEQPLTARVGVHFGEVITWENSASDVANGAKPQEFEGLAVPITARLQAMAMPGQILLSGVAHQLARRAADQLGGPFEGINWVAHGMYHLKGILDPIPIFEVGEQGLAPLRAPAASTKAWPVRSKRQWLYVAACATSALTFAYFSFVSESRLDFSQRDWVVIGDFVDTVDDKRLSETLGTAFRIGIEESSHVNVVPDSTLRQSLARMGRDQSTRIDREVASEIALREHARAVILPSMVRYGTKIRLAVELIDPNVRRTISTQTVDVDNLKEILSAMDRLLRGTRKRLGESLNLIEVTAQPLERVATPNLDALKALSQAAHLERDGKNEQAEKLLAYAIEIDPKFATAYASLGALLFSLQRDEEARKAYQRALAIEGRLSERERLYVKAMLSAYSDPLTMLESWRLYSNLFPGSGKGQHGVGSTYYMYLLDYGNAELALVDAAATLNPARNYTLHTLAHVLLAQEKYELAVEHFKSAMKLSPAVLIFGLSDALVAQEKFDEASEFLKEVKRQDPSTEFERELRRSTLQVAMGDIDAASKTVDSLQLHSEGLPSANDRWRIDMASVALKFELGRHDEARSLATRVIHEASAAAARPATNSGIIEQLLYAATWSARLGLLRQARDAMSVARSFGPFDRHPVRQHLAALAEAEVHLGSGRPESAIAELGRSNGPITLWETHELLARAFQASGNISAETIELRWLASRPGLAYAQYTDQLLGQQARAIALRHAKARLARG